MDGLTGQAILCGSSYVVWCGSVGALVELSSVSEAERRGEKRRGKTREQIKRP